MSTGELACTYAALILHDEGIAVTAEKIATVVKAANVPVESYWPGLFAKLCEKKNIDDLIINAGSAGGASVVAVSAPAADAPSGAAASAPPAAAEETKEDSDDDMNMFDLFG